MGFTMSFPDPDFLPSQASSPQPSVLTAIAKVESQDVQTVLGVSLGALAKAVRIARVVAEARQKSITLSGDDGICVRASTLSDIIALYTDEVRAWHIDALTCDFIEEDWLSKKELSDWLERYRESCQSKSDTQRDS
jgi:hypothetical protein